VGVTLPDPLGDPVPFDVPTFPAKMFFISLSLASEAGSFPLPLAMLGFAFFSIRLRTTSL